MWMRMLYLMNKVFFSIVSKIYVKKWKDLEFLTNSDVIPFLLNHSTIKIHSTSLMIQLQLK